MSKNIIILKPRLDVPFKNIGKISNKRGKILPIRKYWKQFVQIIELKHKKLGHFVKIIEKPLWQFDKIFVKQLTYDKIYVPHHCLKTFDENKELKNTFYYMQMVFPWLFQVDKFGWCADASVWPIQPIRNTDDNIFQTYQKIAFSGISKFEQPIRQNLNIRNGYLLFLCQIPHDQTILLHSTISVSEALIKTLEIAKSLKKQIVVKPHPMNMESMEPLAKIVADRINKGDDVLWGRGVNIHDLINKCEAVFTVNSGGGMEALLHRKPVFCFGKSDYASVSHFIEKDELDWANRFKYVQNYPGFFESYVKSMINTKLI